LASPDRPQPLPPRIVCFRARQGRAGRRVHRCRAVDDPGRRSVRRDADPGRSGDRQTVPRSDAGPTAVRLWRCAGPGGHPPYGFRRNEGKLLEPNPDKAATVRAAFERSAAGALDREIADSLGLPIDTIRGMLLSPLYIGRLRDGSEAHWPGIVPLELWDKVAAIRGARATSTGRKASPSRPYALAMLHCVHCAKRISGDTGFYRHDRACEPYRAALPDLPASRRGRRDGKGYRRELIEDAVGVLLDRVSVNAHLVSEVVHLTEEAAAHGFAYAVPATFTGIVGNGRGERSRTSDRSCRIVVRA
jgi:hypothetical protein